MFFFLCVLQFVDRFRYVVCFQRIYVFQFMLFGEKEGILVGKVVFFFCFGVGFQRVKVVLEKNLKSFCYFFFKFFNGI